MSYINTILIALLTYSLSLQSALPEWYPQEFNASAAATGASFVLAMQHEYIGDDSIRNIVFADADHTLLKTTTPILLRDTITGRLVKDPRTGALIRLPNRSSFTALRTLKNELPLLPWDDIAIEYREMGSIVALDVTDAIDEMVSVLMNSDDMSSLSREYIVTARSDDDTPEALDDYCISLGIDIDGIFAVNNTVLADIIGYSAYSLSVAQKKALVMEAVLGLHTSKGHDIQSVSFYDDGDENLIAAMELLPQRFPAISFSFYDVIHVGSNMFTILHVADGKNAMLTAPDGTRISPEKLAAYHSKDDPLPDE